MISKGLKSIESITGDTFPEVIGTLLLFLRLRESKGLAEGIETEFMAQGLIVF